ncbi:MAG: lactate utilization protein [Odoribacteraceae bacterium]|jgi:L-lactate dehydrogenase complex protein LldF|nr:lactate utilization protein [Odoribacteraceae bacterium]
MKDNYPKAAARFLRDAERAKWHDDTLWMVRQKRDANARSIPEWEQLRHLASQIKTHTLLRLDHYLEQFADSAAANGITVHWAADAVEHNRLVLEILQSAGVKKLVKSKSMLAEECHLNPYLQAAGIEVVESDLGERILQLAGQPPSHIVMPAIHLTRQAVGKLFEEKLHTDPGNSDPTYLTRAARRHLRQHFLTADAAMTGANFCVADSGDVVVCTNEGNADMGVALAPLHVVSAGIEKVIPDAGALAVYTRLLARSATGQPVTAYTTHHRAPRPGCQMHVILVDNGRTDTLANPEHAQTLKCLRCGACMNTCPAYRHAGGYAYSYLIPGPIGMQLGMSRDPRAHAGDIPACSLCYSCNDACPAKVDLADQTYRWRQQLDSMHLASAPKKLISRVLRLLFTSPKLYENVLRLAPLVNRLPRFLVYNRLNAWGRDREMPPFAGESFTRAWKRGKVKASREKSK